MFQQYPTYYIHETIEKHSHSSVDNISSSTVKSHYSKAVGGPVLRLNTTQPISTRSHASSTTSEHNKNSAQRYKTELCRSYQETGLCKYGEKCQFAHGTDELRSLNRHPKYKTVLCRTYHCTGYCPYGPRCHFLHDECSETFSCSSISPSSSFAGDIRSSVSSSRSISPIDSPLFNSNDDIFLTSLLLNQLQF